MKRAVTTRTSIPLSSSRGKAMRQPQNGNSSAPDPTQQHIAALEARIAALEEMFQIDGSGNVRIEGSNKITVKANKLVLEGISSTTLKSSMDLKLVGGKIDCQSNSTARFHAASNFDISASGKGTFSATSSLAMTSSTTASLKGSTTKLGPGTKPVSVSSVGGGVGGVSVSASVPSPTVLA